MESAVSQSFSAPVTVFQERRLPERALPVGYAALIDAHGLSVPLPVTLSAIGARHKTFTRNGWRILTPRHEPNAGLEGHLTFALKYEGVDLAVLKRLFLTLAPHDIEAVVRATPTGNYARRIWFLYEWLTGRELNLQHSIAAPMSKPSIRSCSGRARASMFRATACATIFRARRHSARSYLEHLPSKRP